MKNIVAGQIFALSAFPIVSLVFAVDYLVLRVFALLWSVVDQKSKHLKLWAEDRGHDDIFVKVQFTKGRNSNLSQKLDNCFLNSKKSGPIIVFAQWKLFFVHLFFVHNFKQKLIILILRNYFSLFIFFEQSWKYFKVVCYKFNKCFWTFLSVVSPRDIDRCHSVTWHSKNLKQTFILWE